MNAAELDAKIGREYARQGLRAVIRCGYDVPRPQSNRERMTDWIFRQAQHEAVKRAMQWEQDRVS